MINNDFKTITKVTCDLLKEDDNGEICEALEQMMDDELMKPDDEIDFDFIDKCSQVIYEFHGRKLPKEDKTSEKESFNQERQKNSRVKGIIERVALFEGISFIIAIAGNSISASAFHINLFGNIAEWAQNKVVFNWKKDDTSSSFIKQGTQSAAYNPLLEKLKENNIANIMLPYYHLDDYQISNMKVKCTNNTNKISFVLGKENEYINYFATEFSNAEKMGQQTLLGEYTHGEEFDFGGVKFYILIKGSGTRVLFKKQLTEYMLYTSFNVETTKEILKTIK